MPEEIPDGLVAARYKGHGTGLSESGKYLNTDGTRRKDTETKSALQLEHGDEMLWRDEDVYGKTLWHDPNQNLPSEYIGLGKVVKPKHAGKEKAELLDIGYEFHDPRSDLEPVEPLEKYLKRREKAGKKEKPKEVSQIVVIDQPTDVPAEDLDPLEAMQREQEREF
jgi:hypothetical protein